MQEPAVKQTCRLLVQRCSRGNVCAVHLAHVLLNTFTLCVCVCVYVFNAKVWIHTCISHSVNQP